VTSFVVIKSGSQCFRGALTLSISRVAHSAQRRPHHAKGPRFLCLVAVRRRLTRDRL